MRMLSTAAVAAFATLAGVLPVHAGSPCCCAMPCVVAAPPIKVYEPYVMPQIYVVDQGPVYSGPGIYTNPTVVVPRPMYYPYFPEYRYPGYLPPYSEPSPLRVRAQGVLPRRVVRRWQER